MTVDEQVDALNEDPQFYALRNAVIDRMAHKYGKNRMQADAVALCVRGTLEGTAAPWSLISDLSQDAGMVTGLAFYVLEFLRAETAPDDLTADELTGCDCEGECHTCAEAIARRQAGV